MMTNQALEKIFANLREKSLTEKCSQKPAAIGFEEKTCESCHNVFPVTDFWSAGKGQRTKECKWCKRAESKRLYNENGDAVRDKIRRYQRKKRIENPRAEMLKKAMWRANRAGVDFTITEKDLHWPEFCPVLNIRLIYGAVGAGRALPNSASLDRLDNSKGYIPGNVFIISNRANCIKRDSTLEELKLIVKYVEGVSDVK